MRRIRRAFIEIPQNISWRTNQPSGVILQSAFKCRSCWYRNTSGTAELGAGAREAFKDTFYFVLVWVLTSPRYMIEKQASEKTVYSKRQSDILTAYVCWFVWRKFFLYHWLTTLKPIPQAQDTFCRCSPLLGGKVTFFRQNVESAKESLPEKRRNRPAKESQLVQFVWNRGSYLLWVSWYHERVIL